MNYYIGIDIGTSSAKLTLIDEKGKIAGESSRNYDIIEKKPGFKEIEPETWTRAVKSALKEMFTGENAVDPGQVRAIGTTGQMHTVIFLDCRGKSIRPALMWNDTRTADMVSSMRGQLKERKKISYLAGILSTGSPAINLLWLKENEPEHFAALDRFLIGPDYIVYRLTGRKQTDYCEASTSSLCDLETKTWSEEIRGLFGFPAGIYPEIRGAGQIAGILTKEWTEEFGFAPDTAVLTGTGDNPAAAISTGCFSGGYPVLSFGTSGVLMFPKKSIDFHAKGKNILFSMDGKEIRVLVQGVVQSCGNSFSWWMNKILETEDFGRETSGIDIDCLGENSLLFFPHLTGDKTIYADSELRGAFLGLGTDISRKDMSVAVMEGICMAVRQLAEEMKVPKEALTGLKVIGGGSKNDVWMQILADVLQTDVVQMEGGFGAGYGMAVTAAAATDSTFSMKDVLAQTVKIRKEFHPRDYNAGLYEKKYQKYRRIYEALKII